MKKIIISHGTPRLMEIPDNWNLKQRWQRWYDNCKAIPGDVDLSFHEYLVRHGAEIIAVPEFDDVELVYKEMKPPF